jgi:hypothetical protein
VLTFNLVDSSFQPGSCSVAGQSPALIQWDRSCANPQAPTFYTHEQIFQAPAQGGNQFAWLFESKTIIPQVYTRAPEVLDRFRAVFTHDLDLLTLRPDICRFTPGGGVWVGGSVGGGECKLYEKQALVSMVSSNKRMCELHARRLNIALALMDDARVEVFLGGYNKQSRNWVPIIETLAPYRYSIVMENHQDGLYFTEKLLNCFATGTVPVYLGAREVRHFFNQDGILTFHSEAQLLEILNQVSEEDYVRRMPAIVDNFRRCQGFRTIEDYIARVHFGLSES